MRLYDSEVDPPGRLDRGWPTGRWRDEPDWACSSISRIWLRLAFWDALEVARAPVIATHGNARALRDTVRYLNDDQLRAVAATGGLICPSPMPLGPRGETASLEMLLDHVDYIVALVGAAHVGFGTDLLDQLNARPVGLEDIGESQNIVEGLRHRGHQAEAIDGIMGGNFIRVFREVAG